MVEADFAACLAHVPPMVDHPATQRILASVVFPVSAEYVGYLLNMVHSGNIPFVECLIHGVKT